MKVELPYRFPDYADEIYREAMEYRRLTPSQRFLAIVDLMVTGEAMLATSPHRDALLRQWEADEEAGHRAVRELLARHGY